MVANPVWWSSFSAVSKNWIILILCFIGLHTIAQPKTIDGIVFDKDSKERIAKVNVVNTRTGESVYNNLQAEFHIGAQPGDRLIFSKLNYFSDTLTVKGTGSLPVYLKPKSIMLNQVNVRDTLQSPQKRLLETKKDYSIIYGSIGNRDVLSVSPGGGAGLSIDGLYNMISRKGRNAEHLKEIIERDYHENIIDYRYTKTLVASVTGLREPQLTDFMRKYRPGYYQVVTASDYEFILSIKANYKRYIRNPRALSIPPLFLNGK
ncbi:carboxypeptidase-like regulatory domain-containing protein [Mucilaginibacter sp. RS28]|uniref:Carboxypeptidase-like regulatory domain-containing protein n=1 Tax=Mucilaginibacter straminoryzae TaxID=2932774 RepID=A0A9X1X4X0_9SPHI|nr:carboxypeptidase-like regulatory domain-containing protein [Mucilaginibacter straminoryzae]MCJ8210621.1 carboxypeptidase-like regulatory domain-containing protein [Mucilaginibacter straminoryzae]